MRRLSRYVAAAVVVATPISLLTVGSATQAGASAKVAKSLVCTSISGSVTSSVTISKCNVPAADEATYKSASAKVSVLESGTGAIKWASSGKSTDIKVKASAKGTACPTTPSGSGEIVATGSVTGGNAASAVTSKGQVVSVSICLNSSTGKITIAPHTTAKL